MITIVHALTIAQEDAARHYRDLTVYRTCLVRAAGDWRVDYEPVDPQVQGGGPHYVISGTTGEILSRRYEQ